MVSDVGARQGRRDARPGHAISSILRQIPADRQSMPSDHAGPIITLARTFVWSGHIGLGTTFLSGFTTTEQFVTAHALDKVRLVSRVLQARDPRHDDDLHPHQRTARKVADEAERGFAVGAVRVISDNWHAVGAQAFALAASRRIGGHRRGRPRHRHPTTLPT